MKTCTKCKVDKELVEFGKNKNYKDGLQYECKSCGREYNSNRKHRTDLKIPTIPKECNACGVLKPVEEYAKDSTTRDGLDHRCRGCVRDGGILRNYGLTPEDHTALHASQDGKCDICLTDIEQYHQHTHVDHCHDSGKVRALLCNHCNRGLGAFTDIPEVMRRAADYIEHHREKHQCEH